MSHLGGRPPAGFKINPAIVLRARRLQDEVNAKDRRIAELETALDAVQAKLGIASTIGKAMSGQS